jgi:hypothetical protein
MEKKMMTGECHSNEYVGMPPLDDDFVGFRRGPGRRRAFQVVR